VSPGVVGLNEAVASLAARVGWRAGLGDLNPLRGSVPVWRGRLLLLLLLLRLSEKEGLSPEFPRPKVFSCLAG
jgi:hypothetical protein